MNKLFDFFFKILFEKLPILNLLNGYKTEIGKCLEFSAALVVLLQQTFPGLPYLDSTNAAIVFVSGLFVKYLGEAHSNSKDRRGV